MKNACLFYIVFQVLKVGRYFSYKNLEGTTAKPPDLLFVVFISFYISRLDISFTYYYNSFKIQNKIFVMNFPLLVYWQIHSIKSPHWSISNKHDKSFCQCSLSITNNIKRPWHLLFLKSLMCGLAVSYI